MCACACVCSLALCPEYAKKSLLLPHGLCAYSFNPGSLPPNMVTFDLQLVACATPTTCAVLKGLCDTERDGQREVGLECVVATLCVASMDATQGVM